MNENEEKRKMPQTRFNGFRLRTKPLPSQYASTFEAVPTLANQGGLQNHEVDEDVHQLQMVRAPQKNQYFLPRIGQVRVELNGKSYVGTATAINVDSAQNTVYIITCAHNFISYNPAKEEYLQPTSAWFERRRTTGPGQSETVREYEITQYWMHPGYDASRLGSEHDLAVATFEDSDGFFADMPEMGELDPSLKSDQSLVHIYGYPVKKKGELWGISDTIDHVKVAQKNQGMLEYTIPTSAGQSGSPIFRTSAGANIHGSVLLLAFALCLYNGVRLGLGFDLSCVLGVVCIVAIIVFFDSSKKCHIVGIHTTGSSWANYGVKLTPESLAWISCLIQAMGASQETKQGALTNAQFLGLKDDHFTA